MAMLNNQMVRCVSIVEVICQLDGQLEAMTMD